MLQRDHGFGSTGPVDIEETSCVTDTVPVVLSHCCSLKAVELSGATDSPFDLAFKKIADVH